MRGSPASFLTRALSETPAPRPDTAAPFRNPRLDKMLQQTGKFGLPIEAIFGYNRAMQ